MSVSEVRSKSIETEGVFTKTGNEQWKCQWSDLMKKYHSYSPGEIKKKKELPPVDSALWDLVGTGKTDTRDAENTDLESIMTHGSHIFNWCTQI